MKLLVGLLRRLGAGWRAWLTTGSDTAADSGVLAVRQWVGAV